MCYYPPDLVARSRLELAVVAERKVKAASQFPVVFKRQVRHGLFHLSGQ